MTWIYDSHIHLSDPTYARDMPDILQTMVNVKIKACCVSTDNISSQQTLDLARITENVFPFVGIHPEFAQDDLNLMTGMIHDNADFISGIGEIGLDPTFVQSESDHARQIYVFETLLGLAEKYQKPVSVHSRKSLDDVFDVMTSYSPSNTLIHWFDGNKRQLNTAMDMGFFVSYGPLLIYANDKQTLLSKTDSDKLLVETDGPVRFSRCFEMKSAQIDFIPSIIFCASKILDMSYDDTESLLEKNSKHYLGI